MLSGLGNLLFGTGSSWGGETDNAIVDQTLASQPTPLDTQDTDNGWVLVDHMADNEERSEMDHPSIEEPVIPPEPAGLEGEMEHNEQVENHPNQLNAVQQRNAQRAARAVRATALEEQQVKLMHSMQRRQHVSKTKQLTRRSLDVSNKARVFRKPASAHCRVLRPSGQMNGRQTQRKY